jgi:hypothetical protein
MAGDKQNNSLILKSRGMVATGFNRLLGKPLMKLGKLRHFGYSTLGAFNRAGDKPIRLSRKTKKSALLATYVDDVFLDSFYGDQPFVLDQNSLNIPLRDVPTNVDITGSNFQKIPPITEAEQYTQFKHGQAFPFKPIKLRDWLRAKGKAVIKCENGKAPVVMLKMRRLIPNRFYSVWAFFEEESPQFPMKSFGPVRPLGGVPNMMVSDYSGNGTFERELNFCPMDLEEYELPLSNIFIMYHSNHHFAGTVPTFPEIGRFPGNVAHVHMHFPVAAKRKSHRRKFGYSKK